VPFLPGDIATRMFTRVGRWDFPGCHGRVWVKWEGSGDEPDHYHPDYLDYFNTETDEA
jgi:hypothetical protein